MIANQSNNNAINIVKMAEMFGHFNNCVITYCVSKPLKACENSHVWRVLLCTIAVSLLFYSCYNPNTPVVSHNVEIERADIKSRPIADWYVCGSFTPQYDFLYSESVNDDILSLGDLQNPDSLNPYWYNGNDCSGEKVYNYIMKGEPVSKANKWIPNTHVGSYVGHRIDVTNYTNGSAHGIKNMVDNFPEDGILYERREYLK